MQSDSFLKNLGASGNKGVWVSIVIGKNQAKSKEIKAFNSMYGMHSMVKDGYWTIKAQEYNDNEEIDEINNKCLTYIPLSFNFKTKLDPVDAEWCEIKRKKLNIKLQKQQTKVYV